MKHTYHIHGMTCMGCRAHVENTLRKVDGVEDATVNLEKNEATIVMESHIPIEKFQEALKRDGGRYSIHADGEDHAHPSGHKHSDMHDKSPRKGKGTGVFYCPM